MTAVETSSDLRHARVFVSVLGTEDEKAESLEGLRSSRGYLQATIAGELRLKRTPTLEFAHDEAIERGMRITELLDDEGNQAGPAS